MAAALVSRGIRRAFTVPGESFLPLLDALDAHGVEIITCRHEGAAAFMAQATARLTGAPAVCLVSRAPGATNASIGVHEAQQAGTPMVLIVGQVATALLGRGAFQEVDLPAMFSPLATYATQVEDVHQLGEAVHHAWSAATGPCPGPAVVAVPADLLSAHASAQPVAPAPSRDVPAPPVARILELLADARRPLVLAGGARWDQASAHHLEVWAAEWDLPVAVDFRCQDYLDNESPSYIGELGTHANPRLIARFAQADLVIAVGSDLGDITTRQYRLLDELAVGARVLHAHPASGAAHRSRAVEALPCVPAELLAALADRKAPVTARWSAWSAAARTEHQEWTSPDPEDTGDLSHMVQAMSLLAPPDTVVTNGAGNYTAWVQRFWRFREFGTQLAPRSGSMGYGLPAAIAAGLHTRGRPVVSFGGDGCFLMTGQELATAQRYGVGVTCVVVDNGRYGTIRMHQERAFPGREAGTSLTNPDFTAFARSFGCWAARASTLEDLVAAYSDCLAHPSRVSLIELTVDPQVVAPGIRLAKGGGLEH